MAVKKKSSGGKTSGKANPSGNKGKSSKYPAEEEIWKRDILFLVIFAAAVLLMLSNFGLCGIVGTGCRFLFFSLFGCMAYVFPFVLFAGLIYYILNRKKKVLTRTYIGLCGLFIFVSSLMHMNMADDPAHMPVKEMFLLGPRSSTGGGFIGGIIARLLSTAFGTVGSYIVIIIACVIFAIIMTQRPLVSDAKEKGARAYESVKNKAANARIRKEQERLAYEEEYEKREVLDAKKLKADSSGQYSFDITTEHVPTGRASSVGAVSPSGKGPETIAFPAFLKEHSPSAKAASKPSAHFSPAEVGGKKYTDEGPSLFGASPSGSPDKEALSQVKASPEDDLTAAEHKAFARAKKASAVKMSEEEIKDSVENVEKEIEDKEAKEASPKYTLPPLSLLNPAANTDRRLMNTQVKETADKLQKTLDSFGVSAKVIGYSCGPTVTRYELAPDEGVKVSRIVGLADDIKLNLAASDIRIEAPIPGKAAVGIEVPNKTNSSVALSELLRSSEFRSFKSKLAFAVGIDLAGQIVVTDIAKMPHLLIAGATGSGKSVCINTLILSLLYKAKPDEVKFLMIDPKVVELQVFNDIPHLLIPVVTDPKKASGALNWAVAEMTRRYNAFAEFNVKDLESYNAKAASLKGLAKEGETDPEVLPQIVVIIDELADLMMVSPAEVEDAICRLAQLARAAGIHLVIATQRPSVNVITGLIKANMPSRIALSVTSGVDSRTIIDMVGAEKLLGKGDMLFYPQGYSKPARVQGAFISDEEIIRVVDFLKGQKTDTEEGYNEHLKQSIENPVIIDTPSSENDDRDAYFADAGRLIIEKDKASIGMLQRMFKIGFNRAARIMDQLCEANVVGEEEGTKPRRILMNSEEFEEMLREGK